MVGLILCVIICGCAFGIGMYLATNDNCSESLGAFAGVFIGIIIWFIVSLSISNYMHINSKLISSVEYKIETINGQYWETDGNKKIVHYIDEGKELQSYAASKNKVEYSDTVSVPIFIIEKRDALGWFINFWCGGYTEFTNHRIIMPRTK